MDEGGSADSRSAVGMPIDRDIPYRGILFDFDGTLADTMEGNYRAWRQVLHEVGADIGSEEYFLLEGMKLADVARTLCEKHGVSVFDYAALARKKEAVYLENPSFSFYSGVERLIAALAAAGIPMAIVTAGLHDRIIRSVPSGFLSQFKGVITGESTERNKPFPDPYLTAAKEIGVPISECVVVENAPLGIRSAKAAGATCIAITSTLPRERLQEADWIIGTFADLLDLPVIKSLFMLE